MTVLRNITPSPVQTADAWEQVFGKAIVEAGGKDGRLTLASAERIAQRADEGRLASDNAVEFFKRSGQKTVGAKKLLDLLREETRVATAAAAGPNQRLSLDETKTLPEHLRADVFYLRGKGLPNTVTYPEWVAQVTSIVRDAIDGNRMKAVNGVPWQIKYNKDVASYYDAERKMSVEIHVGYGEIFVSIGASSGSPSLPLVGFHYIGKAPAGFGED